MKHVLYCLMLASIACSLAAAQSKSKGDHVKNQLIYLERQWSAAQQKGDKEALEHILANDYKFTDLDGRAGTKRELMDNVQTNLCALAMRSATVPFNFGEAQPTHRQPMSSKKRSLPP